jgi:cytochrome c oxidase subunit 7c
VGCLDVFVLAGGEAGIAGGEFPSAMVPGGYSASGRDNDAGKGISGVAAPIASAQRPSTLSCASLHRRPIHLNPLSTPHCRLLSRSERYASLPGASASCIDPQQMPLRPAPRSLTRALLQRRPFHSTRARRSGDSPYHYPEGPRSNLPFNPRGKYFRVKYFAVIGVCAPAHSGLRKR